MAATSNIPLATPVTSSPATNVLRDIKPPVQIPNHWLWVMAAIAILLLTAALIFWFRYWQKRKAQIPAVPPVPAHVRARQRLEAALRLIDEPKPFCTVVSDTARTYL